MATSGSINTGSVGSFYFTFEWYRTGYNSSANEHYIHYTLTAHNTPGSYRTVYLKDLWILGVQRFHDESGVAYYDGNIVTSGDLTIPGSTSAGDGWFNVYFGAGVGTSSEINCSLEGSWDLDRIPRYANFTSHYVESTGLNSIRVHWSADANVDWLQYSLNGGSWVNTSGSTYTISGLIPNTQYNIRTRIRRTDSQLWTESGYIYGTTKDIAKVTSAPNINLGDDATINITNPSGASIMYYVETLNPTQNVLKRDAIQGNNIIKFTDEELDEIYKKMGTTNSTVLRFGVVTNNSYWNWLDRTCTLTGNQKTAHLFANEWKRAKVWIKKNKIWKRAILWTYESTGWKRGI